METNYVRLAPIIEETVQKVRNKASGIRGAVLTYDGPNSNAVILGASYRGSVDEVLANLSDDQVQYIYLRYDSTTGWNGKPAFVFIHWVGENIHRMLRARLGLHIKDIKPLLSPAAVTIEATTRSEISKEIIESALRSNGFAA